MPLDAVFRQCSRPVGALRECLETHWDPWELYDTVSKAETEMIRRALCTTAVPHSPELCRFVWDKSGSFCKALGLCISSFSLEGCACWRDPLSPPCPAVEGTVLPVQPGFELAQTSLWIVPEHGILVSWSQALLPTAAWPMYGLRIELLCWHNGGAFGAGILTYWDTA